MARLFFLLLPLASLQSVLAQATPDDSIRHHHTLGEIVVGARGESAERRAVNTLQRVPLSAIAGSDSPAIDGVLRRIAGAHTQTNSRGETLVYIRSAGERQVSVYFDGALLNVPWDNRVDLGLVPTEVVGEIMVAKGVPSVLYGTNVLGGALNMTSHELSHPGKFTQVSAGGGSPGALQGSFSHLGRGPRLSYAFSGGYSHRNALAVPRDADLPHGQFDRSKRTNTDRESVSLFGRATYGTENGARIGLSFLRLDGKKGVAPEGHLDPRMAPVRYWRYPDWSTAMAIASASVPMGATLFRGTLWGSTFDQSILQYESASYARDQAQQDDEDHTFGTRMTLQTEAGSGEFSMALNALTSRHLQTDIAIGTEVSSLRRSFRQHVWSTGIEYAFPGAARMVLGASIDGIATPETGDKPARGAQVDYGLTAGFMYSLSDPWTVRAAAGRKVRFPTMRELFGEALGRFLVNDRLRAESSIISELAVTWEQDGFGGGLTAFLQRTYDTIDQRMVSVKGEDVPRRQRVNLDGSRVAGIEVTMASRLVHGMAFDGNLTWMRPRAFNGGLREPLVEKPALLGLGALRYNHASGFSAAMEAVYTGKAHGLAPANELVPLACSFVVNARLTMLMLPGRWGIQLIARINNITDDVVLPQLGLPGPGREVAAGLEISF